MAALLGRETGVEPAVNIPNDGHISNLPPGAIVEVSWSPASAHAFADYEG